ncbi:MAG: hypothetical protein N7Q72_04070 [Spiroplasma sp. Tabriz.8]|nr:hypothetical protein [Spiroplasma sp. Tabriz.8]
MHVILLLNILQLFDNIILKYITNIYIYIYIYIFINLIFFQF